MAKDRKYYIEPRSSKIVTQAELNRYSDGRLGFWFDASVMPGNSTPQKVFEEALAIPETTAIAKSDNCTVVNLGTVHAEDADRSQVVKSIKVLQYDDAMVMSFMPSTEVLSYGDQRIKDDDLNWSGPAVHIVFRTQAQILAFLKSSMTLLDGALGIAKDMPYYPTQAPLGLSERVGKTVGDKVAQVFSKLADDQDQDPDTESEG